MIKTITRIGNSQGLIFDQTLMDMARLKTGDLLNVTVMKSGAIVLMPAHGTATDEEVKTVARKIIRRHGNLFRNLA
jgi:antitoxin component of MazEF toxin-antitoxin module